MKLKAQKIIEKLKGLFKNPDKKTVIIISVSLVIILLATVFIVKGIKNKKAREKVAQYLSENIKVYDELNMISDCPQIDGNKNTVAGIKEAHRLGAQTVTVDMCFNSDDIPVITDDYDSVSSDTLKLEEIFKLMNEEKYNKMRINLRLRQLSSLSEFNRLFTQYNMNGRVLISGIDKNRYGLISGDSTGAYIYFDYIPEGNVKKDVKTIEQMQKEYGIAGVIIDCKNLSEELSDKLSENGIPFIAGNVNEEADMYEVLSYSISNIGTDNPQKLIEVYDKWKQETNSRVNKEINQKLS